MMISDANLMDALDSILLAIYDRFCDPSRYDLATMHDDFPIAERDDATLISILLDDDELSIDDDELLDALCDAFLALTDDLDLESDMIAERLRLAIDRQR